MIEKPKQRGINVANEVKFEVTLEEKQALDSIKKLVAGVEDFGKQAAKNFESASQSFNVFKGVLGAQVAIKGLTALKDAAVGLFDVIATDGVNAAIAEEQALTRLDTAMKLAGNNTDGAKKEFLAFANALEDTTGVQDDVIIGNVALLQSLTQLSKQGLKDATKAAIDLSKALGVDLESATRALGSAANGNLSQLQRLTKQTFVSGADDAETFALALEKLNKSFGGAAVANFQTFQGAVTGASNSFEDFIKELGKSITENEAVKSAIKLVAEAFKDLEQFVHANRAAINEFITALVTGFISAVKNAVNLIGQFVKFIRDNSEEIKAWGQAILTAVGVLAAIVIALNAAAIAGAVLSGALTLAAGAFAILASPITLIIGGVALLALGIKTLNDNWDLVIGNIKSFAGSLIQFAAPAIETLLKFLLLIPMTLAEIITALEGNSLAKKLIPDAVFVGARALVTTLDGVSSKVKEFGAELQAAGDMQVANIGNIVEAEKTRGAAATAASQETVIAYQVAAAESELFYVKQIQTRDEAFLAELTAQQTKDDSLLALRVQTDQKLLDQYVANLGAQEVAQALSNSKKLAADGKYLEANKVLRDLDKKNSDAAIFSSKAFEDKTNKEKLAGLKETFGNISALQSESNAELFAIGKAAAIANATISGIEATQKALTAAPPPFNFALAAIVGIAAAANIAKIASSQPPKRQGGGLLPGVASPTDTSTFQGAPGELILNRRQQTSLFNAINQNQIGGDSGTVVNIQGNIIADDDSQVQRLIERINDNIQFRNAAFAG